MLGNWILISLVMVISLKARHLNALCLGETTSEGWKKKGPGPC